jgi:hypothetical protein
MVSAPGFIQKINPPSQILIALPIAKLNTLSILIINTKETIASEKSATNSHHLNG